MATRPRYQSHGAKSDDFNAYVLANLRRTDSDLSKPLAARIDEIHPLRALVCRRCDLVATRAQLAGQRRNLLESFWPGAVTVFADVDSPIALAFVERYPTPAYASRLGRKRMAFCAQQACCGRRSAEDLLARLQEAPVRACAKLDAEAKGELVSCLCRTLARPLEQLRLLASRIKYAVNSLDEDQIVTSFVRAGRVSAGEVFAELGGLCGRFATDTQLAAKAGVAPVTHALGESKLGTFQWACNDHSRAAIACLADNSRQTDAKAPGCDHPRNIRFLAQAWLRVVWRAWTHRKTYEPAQHRAAKLLFKTAGG